jgi:uncharacterized protein YeaO (DUF488 family)
MRNKCGTRDFKDTAFQSEEERYRAFKARFMEEMRQARECKAAREDRMHDEIMDEVYGYHGQG